MLAEAAGISKALIFHHFTNKKNLYFCLLEHCLEKIETNLPVDFIIENQDFFEALDQITRLKFNYYRKFPDEYKLVYEAFYFTPAELKEDMETKYGPIIAARYQVLEQLFEKVELQEGVERKQAFELVKITLDHLKSKLLKEITDLEAVDDEYVQNLFDEMKQFYNMIRGGIAK